MSGTAPCENARKVNIEDSSASKRIWYRLGFGLFACLCYCIHATYNLLCLHPENLLWACHVGTLLVGTGLILGSPSTNAIGFLWLAAGIPLWLLDIFTGGEFIVTSCASHFGGLAAGAYGIAILGMPRGTRWKALLGVLVLQQICRWTTPSQFNVNLAFSVWSGWENVFHSYDFYMMLLLAIAAGVFSAFEFLLSRLTPPGAMR